MSASTLYGDRFGSENGRTNEVLEMLLECSVGPGYCAARLRRRQWVECRGRGQPKQLQFSRAWKLLLREAPSAAAECTADDLDWRERRVGRGRILNGPFQPATVPDC